MKRIGFRQRNYEDARLNLSRKKNELQRALDEFDKLQLISKPTNDIVAKKSELKLRIFGLTKEISDVTNGTSELDYYSKVDDILMTYYDVIDDNGTRNTHEEYTTSIEQMNLPQAKKQSRRRTKSTSPNKNILQFFVQKPTASTQPSPVTAPTLSSESDKSSTEEKKEDLPKNRMVLLDLYAQVVDSRMQKRTRNVANYCVKCSLERVLFQSEGMYTCPSCGDVQIALIESEIHNYKDSVTDKPSYPYKRKNHEQEFGIYPYIRKVK